MKTYIKEITSANILEVTAGSTGLQGGDAGHGCRTLFRIKDLASTSWTIKIDDEVIKYPTQFEIVLGGDCEAETFVEALEFAAKVLRGKIGSPIIDVPEPKDENIDLH